MTASIITTAPDHGSAPIFSTSRTTLTVLKPDQANLINDYFLKNRDHLKKWEPKRNDSFFTLESWKKRVEDTWQEYLEGRAVCFAVFNKSKEDCNAIEGPMIAGCNFRNIVRGVFHACHLGFSIDADYQGKGIMYESCRAAINYMFTQQKLHRIMANHLPYNTRSQKLLQKLGFEKEGYAKEYLMIAGKWQDHILTALINKEYKEK